MPWLALMKATHSHTLLLVLHLLCVRIEPLFSGCSSAGAQGPHGRRAPRTRQPARVGRGPVRRGAGTVLREMRPDMSPAAGEDAGRVASAADGRWRRTRRMRSSGSALRRSPMLPSSPAAARSWGERPSLAAAWSEAERVGGRAVAYPGYAQRRPEFLPNVTHCRSNAIAARSTPPQLHWISPKSRSQLLNVNE